MGAVEPQIQYCKTSDGVSIAYWTMGEGGTPLVLASPTLFTHAAFELRNPPLRAWYERLASRRMIVRYDARGQGLSQRSVGAVTSPAFASDLHAVIEALSLKRVDLAGFYGPCRTMTIYAIDHAERVRRLVLWAPSLSNEAFTEGHVPAVLSLIERDWQLFTETFARTFLGWTGDLAHEWAAFMRVAISQEDAAHLFTAITAEEQPDLSLVQASTLVLYEASGGRSIAEAASHVAANIEGARLVPLEHKLIPAFESEQGTRAIEEFLSNGTQPTGQAPRQPASSGAAARTGLTVILFADIADSTALTERLGDAAFRERARQLDAALRDAIAANGGTPIDGKLLGDGVLATFGAAREAIACARELHRLALTPSPPPMGEGPGEGSALLLHIGIHAGDVIREERNVFGGAVNVAARISDAAAAGETLVSGTVRDLARTSAGVSFEDRGARTLKGIEEPVRVWAVVPHEAPLPFREGAGG